MEILLFIVVVLLIPVLAGIYLYNRLVRKKNLMEESWSGIDAGLKKRHDLIPGLVASVKGYTAHESQTLDNLTRYRSSAMQAQTPADKATAETGLNRALGQLFAVAENYPDLKASVNFQQLQTDLSEIETDLLAARRYYNATVRENNVLVESFPANIIARSFGFRKGEFFEITDMNERKTPAISF